MDSQLKKRIKSFVWRGVMMLLGTLCTYIIDNVTGLGLPAYVTVIVGLVFGEISKYINSATSQY